MNIEAALRACIPSPWKLRLMRLEREHVTMPLCIDILPNRLEICIDSKPLTGGSAELQSGFLFRHCMGWSHITAFQASEALQLAEEDCEAILKGYHAEQLWSGDWFCQWQPEAVAAAERLARALEKSFLGML